MRLNFEYNPKFPFFGDRALESSLHKIIAAKNWEEIADSTGNYCNLPGIHCSYTKWCNNNGGGYYINKQRFKDYHWLNGRDIPKSSYYLTYAIRFDITISEEMVKHKAFIILKRHANRWLKLNQFN